MITSYTCKTTWVRWHIVSMLHQTITCTKSRSYCGVFLGAIFERTKIDYLNRLFICPSFLELICIYWIWGWFECCSFLDYAALKVTAVARWLLFLSEAPFLTRFWWFFSWALRSFSAKFCFISSYLYKIYILYSLSGITDLMPCWSDGPIKRVRETSTLRFIKSVWTPHYIL